MAKHGNHSLDWMWDTPIVQKHRTLGWWWWFILFLIETPEDPQKPRQLMTLWSIKDVGKVIVNGKPHYMPERLHRTDEKDEFHGVLAGWYYDGNKMNHDIVLSQADISIRRKTQKDPRRIQISGKNNCTLARTNKGYLYTLNSPNLSVKFNIKPDLSNTYYQPIRERSSFLGGMIENHILKINRFNLAGNIIFQDQNEQVNGIGYFQRIIVNTPVPPWYWAVVFFDNGSMIKYFLPNLSLALFRRTLTDNLKFYESAFKPIKKELDFYDAETDQIFSFKKARVEKIFKKDGFPAFKLHFWNENSNLKFTLNTYTRTWYQLTTDILGLPVSSTLYWNEFPCYVESLSLETPDIKRSLDDLGRGIGNCEHAWGVLL